jgi:hypothetical protein
MHIVSGAKYKIGLATGKNAISKSRYYRAGGEIISEIMQSKSM